MKYRLIIVLILMTMTLPGCSMVSFGYKNADIYLRYTVNSYTTFTSEQKDIISRDVDDFMAWNRSHMLPEYIGFLLDLQDVVNGKSVLNLEHADRIRSGVRRLFVKTMAVAIKPAASLLVKLDAGQIAELEKSFLGEYKKLNEKELGGGPQEQLRKRAEKTIDFIESVAGDLSDEQLLVIREMSRQMPFTTRLYYDLRLANQLTLVSMLKEGKSEADIATFLATWLNSPESFATDDERKLMRSFEKSADDMIVKVFEMLSSSQKEKLQKSISKYLGIFQDLAGK